MVRKKWTYHKEWSFASSFFENFVSVWETLLKSWFDVLRTQMPIFLLFVTTGVLFHGVFPCEYRWTNEKHFPKTLSEWESDYDFLQIYRQLLSLATFLRVHSNSKVVSYLSWQNRYPNLKTTCHIKLKFFLWTTILKNLLLAKYFISVAATLIIPLQILFNVNFSIQIFTRSIINKFNRCF